jgi:hypothetical protein
MLHLLLAQTNLTQPRLDCDRVGPHSRTWKWSSTPISRPQSSLAQDDNFKNGRWIILFCGDDVAVGSFLHDGDDFSGWRAQKNIVAPAGSHPLTARGEHISSTCYPIRMTRFNANSRSSERINLSNVRSGRINKIRTRARFCGRVQFVQ